MSRFRHRHSLGEAITPRSMGEKQALDVGPLQHLERDARKEDAIF